MEFYELKLVEAANFDPTRTFVCLEFPDGSFKFYNSKSK